MNNTFAIAANFVHVNDREVGENIRKNTIPNYSSSKSPFRPPIPAIWPAKYVGLSASIAKKLEVVRLSDSC